jgi:hypothetical protein
MEDIEIRIRRKRTPAKLSTWEILERWASLGCQTIPGQLRAILEDRECAKSWAIYLREERNRGRATT